YELIDGEVFVAPSPDAEHQRLSVRLSYYLYGYLREQPIGEVFTAPFDVELDEDNVFQPDLLVVLSEHGQRVGRHVRGAPDLVVEILSPSTAVRDRNVKLTTYAARGVAELWLAEPRTR